MKISPARPKGRNSTSFIDYGNKFPDKSWALQIQEWTI